MGCISRITFLTWFTFFSVKSFKSGNFSSKGFISLFNIFKNIAPGVSASVNPAWGFLYPKQSFSPKTKLAISFELKVSWNFCSSVISWLEIASFVSFDVKNISFIVSIQLCFKLLKGLSLYIIFILFFY